MRRMTVEKGRGKDVGGLKGEREGGIQGRRCVAVVRALVPSDE